MTEAPLGHMLGKIFALWISIPLAFLVIASPLDEYCRGILAGWYLCLIIDVVGYWIERVLWRKP